MQTPLSLVTLVLSLIAGSAGAGQLTPGTDAPQTHDVTAGPGGVSRDPGELIKSIGTELARYAGIPDIEFVHVPNMYGVSLECDFAGGQVRAREGYSPAASVDCGKGKAYVATGYAVFSMAAQCKDGGISAGPEDTLAAVLAHEISHVAASHSARRIENIKRICNDWAQGWLPTPEAETTLGPLVAKGKPAVLGKLLDVCQERKKDEISRSQQPLEREADANASLLIRNHNAAKRGGEIPFSDGAVECAMRGLQDLDWAVAMGAPVPDKYVSDHPGSKERVEEARKVRLMFVAMQACKDAPADALCVNRFAK